MSYEELRISVRMLQCCSNIAEWDIITQLGHAAAGRGGGGNGEESLCQATVRAW